MDDVAVRNAKNAALGAVLIVILRILLLSFSGMENVVKGRHKINDHRIK